MADQQPSRIPWDVACEKALAEIDVTLTVQVAENHLGYKNKNGKKTVDIKKLDDFIERKTREKLADLPSDEPKTEASESPASSQSDLKIGAKTESLSGALEATPATPPTKKSSGQATDDSAQQSANVSHGTSAAIATYQAELSKQPKEKTVEISSPNVLGTDSGAPAVAQHATSGYPESPPPDVRTLPPDTASPEGQGARFPAPFFTAEQASESPDDKVYGGGFDNLLEGVNALDDEDIGDAVPEPQPKKTGFIAWVSGVFKAPKDPASRENDLESTLAAPAPGTKQSVRSNRRAEPAPRQGAWSGAQPSPPKPNGNGEKKWLAENYTDKQLNTLADEVYRRREMAHSRTEIALTGKVNTLTARVEEALSKNSQDANFLNSKFKQGLAEVSKLMQELKEMNRISPSIPQPKQRVSRLVAMILTAVVTVLILGAGRYIATFEQKGGSVVIVPADSVATQKRLGYRISSDSLNTALREKRHSSETESLKVALSDSNKAVGKLRESQVVLSYWLRLSRHNLAQLETLVAKMDESRSVKPLAVELPAEQPEPIKVKKGSYTPEIPQPIIRD